MVKEWEVSSNFKTLPFIFTERMDKMIPDYPANSAKSKQEAKEKEQQDLKPTIPEGVRIKPKKSKLFRAIFKQDFQDIRKGLINDYVYPKTQELAWSFIQACIDTVTNAMKMMIFENYKPTTGTTKSTPSGYSYSGYYNSQANKPVPTMSTEIDYDEFTYVDRGKAEEILYELRNLIATTKSASVLDLYNLSQVGTSNYTLQNWGWTDLSFAEIREQWDSDAQKTVYYIALPKARPLKK